MKIIRDTYNATLDEESLRYIDEYTCFADIETIGLSKSRCNIYMIGLSVLIHKPSVFELTLLFAENLSEEEDILNYYLTYTSNIKRFISFNGLNFDFPFIKHRLSIYGIEYDYDRYDHVDIYRKCLGLKELLGLTNLKQKTIEAFFGTIREDRYTGGELIKQYLAYVKSPDEEIYDNLVTHNLEDVRGMIDLLAILRYTDILSLIDKSSSNITVDKNDNNIRVTLTLGASLPTRFTKQSDNYYIVFEQDKVKLLLMPTRSTMRYYLDDYRNYRYLAEEDIIIHKRLLSSSNIKRATPVKRRDCFVESSGYYLPVYDKELFGDMKLFQLDYDNQCRFIDISNYLDDHIFIERYVYHLLETVV